MGLTAPKAIAIRGTRQATTARHGWCSITVVTTSEEHLPTGFAAETMRQFERLATSRPDYVHPHQVVVVATRADGDRFAVVYRQRRSPRLLSGQGNTATFSALFRPRLGAEHLAQIVLQALSEPEDRGRPRTPSWVEGLVPDPAAVSRLTSLE